MELFNKIKSTVKREGLQWGENCALKPVAYGIKKICMTAVIPMNVAMDEIIEEILEDVFPVIIKVEPQSHLHPLPISTWPSKLTWPTLMPTPALT